MEIYYQSQFFGMYHYMNTIWQQYISGIYDYTNLSEY